MAERKSQNKYYPPDWDPSKGSVNKYVGQHPLRDRAKKISQGILVIRFEMPYNIWCGGCNSHIGMGVRYNAEKKKVGNYYSTPIWLFRMKCHLCDNYFEIQTDPKNHDYVILNGARRKEQRWDPKENEQIATEDKAVQKKLATDAMYKLEHGADDHERGKKSLPSVGQLEEHMSQFKDDYILNKMARNKFREEKKALKAEDAADKSLLQKSSLDIQLVKESEDDVRLAGLLKYKSTETYDEKQLQKRKEIESRPIFHKSVKPADDSESPSSKAELLKKKLSTSIISTKPNPFDNVTSTYRTLMLSQKMLGIRKKQNSVSQSKSSVKDKRTSSEYTSQNEGDIVCMDESDASMIDLNTQNSEVPPENVDRLSNDNKDNDLKRNNISSTGTCEEKEVGPSNKVNALGLVSVYSDTDSDNSCDT